MKLINNNNPLNIITDQDITMTSPSTEGHSLSLIITKQEQDINTLKSNVKWMYKYGGVGSGGAGGGSGTSSLWNFKVELDDVLYKDKETANLGKVKGYKLNIALYKVQGRSFDLKITFPNVSGGLEIINAHLDPSREAVFTKIINLEVNGDLIIFINDDEGNSADYKLTYVVTPYEFKLSYVLTDKNKKELPYSPTYNNIFVKDIENYTLWAKFDYIINAEILEGTYLYKDWNNIEHKKDLKFGVQSELLELGKPIIDENAGNYTFNININLILGGKKDPEPIEPLKLSDNIIPSNTYLKVESDGILYDKPFDGTRYEFYTGNVLFKVTPFQGPRNTNIPYKLTVELNNKIETEIQLLDLTEYDVVVVVNEVNKWNSVKFTLKRSGQTYEKIYYFYTINASDDFVWYPTLNINNQKNTIIPGISYQFHASGKGPKSRFTNSPNLHNILDSFNHEYTVTKEIHRLTQSDKDLEFHGNFNQNSKIESEWNKYIQDDYLISIGLKYSRLNDVNKPLIAIKGKESTRNIEIYQNKVVYNSVERSIYIPKDDKYHLITIYRRAINEVGSQKVFELDLYIDGILETAFAALITEPNLMHTIILRQKCLYSVNYLEISYFKHTPLGAIPGQEEQILAYNLNPLKNNLDYFNDSSILYHYYSYKMSLITKEEEKPFSDEFKLAYTIASGFYQNYKTNRIEVDSSMISLLAGYLSIPILEIDYLQDRVAGDDNWNKDGEDIFKWMETGYKIKTNPEILDERYPVKIQWAGKESSELKEINTTSANTTFNISLQGTSTLGYRNKNFDLFLETSDSQNTYLYSPNYDSTDNSTFLPEKRFTLKADIVDSSHSNNNVIGKFINTITTKYNKKDPELEKSPHNRFVKNTLEGFPILLFFKNGYYKNSTGGATNDYYYLGIYNFNLGRDTEFNLGYKDLRLLPDPDKIPQGFNVIKIPNLKKIGEESLLASNYLPNFGVAEVLENEKYFDFSLYDESILFKLLDNSDDVGLMFGKMKSNDDTTILKPALKNLVEEVSKAGGYVFDLLQKTMLPKENLKGGYECGYVSSIPLNIVPNYRLQYKRKYNSGLNELEYIKNLPEGKILNFTRALIGESIEGGEYKNNPLIDYLTLSEYYVCCMALGLVDSVLKNLNLKTWDGNTFYASFYDMDTALGKDNAGENTNYLAFSDYWKPNYDKSNEKWKLLPAISYKDWSPVNYIDPEHPDIKNTYKGYDIPITYLFALVKYGSTILDEKDNLDIKERLKNWYPNNLWARFRREDRNISWVNTPSNLNDNHIGCLQNADVFINNFFKKHLENVPDVFFNLNYRKKYFVLDTKGTGFVGDEFLKFSGKRIYYVHDWLDKRLHILDLYFNLSNISESITKYDSESLKFINIGNKTYLKIEPYFIDSSNTDIIVLQDIFLEEGLTTARKYSNSINIEFTSEENSPISLSGGTTYNALTDTNQKTYVLNLDTYNKAETLGGSGNWLTINKIDSLIQGDSGSSIFYVNSDKLTNLTGTSGVCSSWKINLPSILNIILSSKEYVGELKFTLNVPNLDSINISNSKLGLNLLNLNITKVIANNVITSSNLNILNCEKLNTIEYKNSRFKSINFTTNKNILFFGDHPWEKIGENWRELTSIKANSPKCQYLNITCKSKDGIIFIGQQEYLVDGFNEGLEEITLEGFKEIYIKECPHLRKLNIIDPENVNTLKVETSSRVSKNLLIGVTPNTINLMNFINLKIFSFRETFGFYLVYLPSNSNLIPNCFYNTWIRYLKGTNIKLCNSAFNWSGYTLYEEEGSKILTDFIIDTTNLSYTFDNCNVSTEAFNLFNFYYKESLSKIINASYMWGNNPVTRYTEEDLKKDLANNTCRFTLESYPNVIDARGMIRNDYSTSCHPDMLKGLGSNYQLQANDPNNKTFTGINIENIFGWNHSTKKITIPINWLNNIETRVSNYNLNNLSTKIKVVSIDSGEIIPKESFHITELLTPNKYITELKYWIFDSYVKENSEIYHTISFKGSPFSELNFPKLQSILYSFCNCNASNLETNQFGFLYNKVPSLNKISSSFGFINYKNIEINLATMFNWELILKNELFTFSDINKDLEYHVGEFNKYINSSNTFKLIVDKIMKYYSGDKLSHLFLNCKIIYNGSPLIFDNIINSNIKDISYLFTNLKFILDNKEVFIPFDWSIIKHMNKLTTLKNTFENIKFEYEIPFNFFGIREEFLKTVYIKKEEDYKEATLHLFEYNDRRIKYLNNCFKNCLFKETTFVFNNLSDKLYNYSILGYSPSYVEYITSEGISEYYTEYYTTNNPFTTLFKLIDNSEYNDLNMETSYKAKISNISKNSTCTFEEYLNFNRTDFNNIRNPFIAPDFFYGCSSTVEAISCFEGCNLEGYIPDNLFKYNKDAVITNFIKNILIFPKLLKGSRYNKDINKKYTIYYYIGHEFINSVSLDNLFNFRIALTDDVKHELENNENVNNYTLYIFSFTDSFNKNIISAKHAFDFKINAPKENCTFSLLNEPHNIYFNLMYDKDSEKEREGKLILGDLGLDLNKFRYLDLDLSITGLIILFTYGNLFNENASLGDIKMHDVLTGNWAIELGNRKIPGFKIGDFEFKDIVSGQFGISNNIKLPGVVNYNPKTILINVLGYNTITNSIPSRGYENLLVRVDNFTSFNKETTISLYNKSITNYNSGSIQLHT